jgi:chemotaxis protein MotB
VNLERWLVSYADFITLLFAFFVVMYAISQADIAKFRKVSASLRAAFSAGSPVGVIELQGTSGGNTVSPFDAPINPGGRILDLPAGKVNVEKDADGELRGVKDLLEDTLSVDVGATDASTRPVLTYDSRGLVLSFVAKDFFAPGASEVREDFRPLLDRIGKALSHTHHLIRVEGHADSMETALLNSPQGKSAEVFKGLWELSAARSIWVTKYWVKRFDFDPRQISIAAFAATEPLQDDSSFAHDRNRRVEIIVLKSLLPRP